MSQENQSGGERSGNGYVHPPEDTASGPESQEAAGQARGRRPRGERENAFDVTAWLLEGLTGLSEELRHNDLGLPEDFWVHAYAARKEALLAAKALVEAALERCADEEADAPPKNKKPPQRGQVSIDFD